MVAIIGHRGGRNEWPENSLLGFRELARLGVEGVEFDVHLTKAGEMLVMHDPSLDRTTQSSGMVADLKPGERHQFVLKNSIDQTIPTLEEVLDVFRDTDMELQVELKADQHGNPYPGLEAKASELIRSLGLAERSVLTSFLPEVLAECRKQAPDIRTLSSYDQKSADRMGGVIRGLERQLEVSDIVAVEKSVLKRHWDEISALVPGDRLGAWVPNEAEEIAFWFARPIRQITTDCPSLSAQLRRG